MFKKVFPTQLDTQGNEKSFSLLFYLLNIYFMGTGEKSIEDHVTAGDVSVSLESLIKVFFS
jgi:hypothetical protein